MNRAMTNRRLVIVAAVVVLAAAGVASAAGPEEKGVGFGRPVLEAPKAWSVSLPKVVLVLALAAVVFCGIRWALVDIRMVRTDPGPWGGLMVAGGLAALAAAVLVPLFYIGLPLGAILFAGATANYAMHRNRLVTPALTVLTAAHWVRLKRRLRGREVLEQETGPVTGAGRNIIFMGLDDLPIRIELASGAEHQARAEVEQVLCEGILRRASLVGLLVRPQKVEVRFRVGGVMVSGGDLSPPASNRVAGIVKRLAGLEERESRKPQEGRMRAVVGGQSFDLRIRSAGTVRGEQIVVRIIDVAASRRCLEDLGLDEPYLKALAEALGVRPGLVVLSSPKDSGLTTTLHACLRHFDRYTNNVVIFEPRIDLEVENVQHVAISQEDGPVAVAEVRKQLRMEPDVVAFDVLYLAEAAQALVEAAKERTVLIGLRAADTTQALKRLAALVGSVGPVAEPLQMVVNQRLVRLLCPDCREAYRPNPEFLRKANLGSQRVEMLHRPPTRVVTKDGQVVVCPRCRNGRYVGRTAMFELMPADEEAREMIRRGATVSDLRVHARKLGMRNLQEEGLRLVISGRTSIDEVLRAIKQET